MKEILLKDYALLQKYLKPDSKESDELEILSILVKKYESQHYPVALPNPLEAIFTTGPKRYHPTAKNDAI